MEQFGSDAAADRRRRRALSSALRWRASSIASAPGAASQAQTPATTDEPLGRARAGSRCSFADRYLMLIAALASLLNVVNTSGEYLFGRYVVETANATYGAGAATRKRRGSSSSARPTAACSATST